MAVRVGMRLTCSKCGAEVIITKQGTGKLTCCGEEMNEVAK
jgi:desulfoferrodoxin-like iron-binding protein